METLTVTEQCLATPWKVLTRISFRLCCAYFGLYCLANQIITSLFPIPKVEIPDPSTLGVVRQIVFWTAAHVFHAKLPLVYSNSGSGDKTFDWVLDFCLLILALLISVIWSLLDRRRENYRTFYKWFRIFIRFALAGQMMTYGFAKAIPLQMPFPFLTQLVEPFGNFSPMGVLWSFVGASPAYETFTGCAEILGGLLLIVPRTTMLGALICLADMIQIFTLNMTYDVPVKLLSFHLILLSLFILSPDLQRLFRFFFMNRATEPSSHVRMFESQRANRIGLAAQLLFALWLTTMNLYGTWANWSVYGGARPKSPLYGIWTVEELTSDGQPRLPLPTDKDRWCRAIFDFPDYMAFQRIDGTLAYYGASFDTKHSSVAFTNNRNPKQKASFTYQRPAPDQLTLDGEMDSHKVHMQLRLADQKQFLLLSRGFHWIQEYPFNR